MIKSFYKSDNRDFTIVHGDCFDVLPQFDFKFDMIFADPPYFLSNGGIRPGKSFVWIKASGIRAVLLNPSWSLTANGCLYAEKSLKIMAQYGFPVLTIISFQ